MKNKRTVLPSFQLFSRAIAAIIRSVISLVVFISSSSVVEESASRIHFI